MPQWRLNRRLGRQIFPILRRKPVLSEAAVSELGRRAREKDTKAIAELKRIVTGVDERLFTGYSRDTRQELLELISVNVALRGILELFHNRMQLTKGEEKYDPYNLKEKQQMNQSLLQQ